MPGDDLSVSGDYSDSSEELVIEISTKLVPAQVAKTFVDAFKALDESDRHRRVRDPNWRRAAIHSLKMADGSLCAWELMRLVAMTPQPSKLLLSDEWLPRILLENDSLLVCLMWVMAVPERALYRQHQAIAQRVETLPSVANMNTALSMFEGRLQRDLLELPGWLDKIMAGFIPLTLGLLDGSNQVYLLDLIYQAGAGKNDWLADKVFENKIYYGCFKKEAFQILLRSSQFQNAFLGAQSQGLDDVDAIIKKIVDRFKAVFTGWPVQYQKWLMQTSFLEDLMDLLESRYGVVPATALFYPLKDELGDIHQQTIEKFQKSKCSVQSKAAFFKGCSRVESASSSSLIKRVGLDADTWLTSKRRCLESKEVSL